MSFGNFGDWHVYGITEEGRKVHLWQGKTEGQAGIYAKMLRLGGNYQSVTVEYHEQQQESAK